MDRVRSPTALPDRVWVMGPCGSGKSTLAARLAEIQGVAPTHLDDLHWQADWTEAPREETWLRVADVVARPRWVVDGNYARFRARALERIQLLVWLDLPLYVTFPRLVRRGVRRSALGESCCNGNHETLLRTFLHRDSLLLWALTGSLRQRPLQRRHARTCRSITLRSQREVDRWLERVTPSRLQR